MKLKDQVVSLELAKKLKELGVKQESLFCWFNPKEDKKNKDWQIEVTYTLMKQTTKITAWVPEKNIVSAFTVAELGKLLPTIVLKNNKENHLKIWRNDSGDYWYCGYGGNLDLAINGSRGTAKTEADARAKMLIYLIENNLIHTTKP